MSIIISDRAMHASTRITLVNGRVIKSHTALLLLRYKRPITNYDPQYMTPEIILHPVSIISENIAISHIFFKKLDSLGYISVAPGAWDRQTDGLTDGWRHRFMSRTP